MNRNIVHISETWYFGEFMIMINMSTIFQDSIKSPVIEYSRVIKFKFLKDNINIYKNIQHTLLSW